jgi:hypothetical protein
MKAGILASIQQSSAISKPGREEREGMTLVADYLTTCPELEDMREAIALIVAQAAKMADDLNEKYQASVWGKKSAA